MRKGRGFAPGTAPESAALWTPAKGGALGTLHLDWLDGRGPSPAATFAAGRLPAAKVAAGDGPLPSNQSKRMDCKGTAFAGGPWGRRPLAGFRAEPWPCFVHRLALPPGANSLLPAPRRTVDCGAATLAAARRISADMHSTLRNRTPRPPLHARAGPTDEPVRRQHRGTAAAATARRCAALRANCARATGCAGSAPRKHWGARRSP